MVKNILIGTLAACCMSANAADTQTWNFEWSGYFEADGSNVPVHRTFRGSFSAVDLNADQIILTDELTAFTIQDNSLMPCRTTECEVGDFTYSGSNNLSFYASQYSYDPGSEGWPAESNERYWDTFLGAVVEVHCSGTGCDNIEVLNALPGDRMTVTLAVPEPGTYLMLGAGLMGLGIFHRRKIMMRPKS